MGGRIPVLGHTFVGLAAADFLRPPKARQPEHPARIAVRELWTFLAVLLAYAPDICAQALQFAGWSSARLFCHSLLFAVSFPALCAIALNAVGVPPIRGFLFALFPVVAHDVLDIGQATDKMPFWPFSVRPVSLRFFHIPSGLIEEILLFGGIYLLYRIIRQLAGQQSLLSNRVKENLSPLRLRFAVVNRILLVSIILLAAATHGLRDLRERQLDTSRSLIEKGRYVDGLKLLEESERWPSTAKAGRADYLRGVASLGKGEREKAETYLLASYRADPAYPWVVIDLARFYAEPPYPVDLRRKMASRYLEILRRDFREMKEASEAAERVEAILSSGDRSR